MALQPDSHHRRELQAHTRTEAALVAPGDACLPELQKLPEESQRRLLSNLRCITRAIETFGETIAAQVIPPLTAAVESSPSAATGATDAIRRASNTLASTVAELDASIDWLIRGGNQPLREYRDIIEDATNEALRLLAEATPGSNDETWRIKIFTSILLLRQAISDDCEAITPNLLFLIGQLETLLPEDKGGRPACA